MLLKHVFGIILNPAKEWQVIRDARPNIKSIYLSFVVLLGAIAPICGYIGTTMVGWSVGDSAVTKLTPSSAGVISILFYLAILIAVVMIGWMIRWMGETYGFPNDLDRCVALSAFTVTPLFLIGVFLLFSRIWVIYLIGLPATIYTVYLLYLGVPIMLDLPKEKGFLLSSSILAVGLVALVGMLGFTVILWGMNIAPNFTS